jgi:hypothetical protein
MKLLGGGKTSPFGAHIKNPTAGRETGNPVVAHTQIQPGNPIAKTTKSPTIPQRDNNLLMNELLSCGICPLNGFALVYATIRADTLVIWITDNIPIVEIPHHKVPSRIKFRSVFESDGDVRVALYWDGLEMMGPSEASVESKFSGKEVMVFKRTLQTNSSPVLVVIILPTVCCFCQGGEKIFLHPDSPFD